jgi:hypothetical protein
MGSLSGSFEVEDALAFTDRIRMGGALREGCGVVAKRVGPMTAPEAQRAGEVTTAFRHLL